MSSQIKFFQTIQQSRFKFKQNQIQNPNISKIEISSKTAKSFKNELNNTHFSHDRRRKRTLKNDIDEKFETFISSNIRNVNFSNMKKISHV